MFGAVMLDEDNCRRFLEMLLELQIERIEVSKEKSIVYHPEYKGVRLDVYAKDESNTRYNIEMQVAKETSLNKRSRYYQSQIDMEILAKGEDYKNLPDTYVIFICDFDPFGEEKYCYTFKNRCFENNQLILDDGCCTIFLSTKGKNDKEVSVTMKTFLKYVGAELEESWEDFEDDFVKQLQKSVQSIKASREMGERHMLFEELLISEREEGRKQGLEQGRKQANIELVLKLLEKKGKISEELNAIITEETDIKKLDKAISIAIEASSVEQFHQKYLDL